MSNIATAYILIVDISKSPVINYKQMAYIYRMFPANRLRELRKEAKLTQIELAELSGISQSAISQLENDTLGLDVQWMRSFARIFTQVLKRPISSADLLGDADYPNRPTAEEEELLRHWRSADDQQREMIQRVAAPMRPFRHGPTDDANGHDGSGSRNAA